MKFLYEVWATLSSSELTTNAPYRNSTAYMKYISPPAKPAINPTNTALRIDFLQGWDVTEMVTNSGRVEK